MSERGATVETEALLLRSTPYRDADLIVTLLTASLGRVSALARSARKSRKRFGGTLQPFVHFRARLARGSGELYSLRDTEPIEAYAPILADLDRVQASAAGLLFVRELSPAEAPDRRLFADTLRFLAVNAHQPDAERAALLAFALGAMAGAGSAPGFERCVRCAAVAPEGRAGTFDASRGGLVCRACGGASHVLPAEARRWLARAQKDWLVCARAPLTGPSLAPARAAVADFVTVHLGEKLASGLYPAT